MLPVSVVRDLGSTLTLTWVWEPASLQPSGPVLRRCDRSVVCAVHWRRMLCWLLRALVITKLDFCCSTLADVSGTLLQRLQSVLNAAAQLVYSARRSEHTTLLLRQLHWLKVSERIKFRLCVLVHRCLHNKTPRYLAESLHLTTEVDARRCLWSASTSTLTVPSTRRSTIGDRAFPVAAACVWNSLPYRASGLSRLWTRFGTTLPLNLNRGCGYWPSQENAGSLRIRLPK